MTKEPRQITCPPELDITQAERLHEAFRQLLDTAVSDQPIFIDASRVTRADGAGLQLLCALFSAAEQRGIALSWAGASPAIGEAARLLGVEGHLQIPS